MRAIYGKKLMMTRLFDEKGKVTPVTVVEANDNIVTQVKHRDKNGYQALQLGVGAKRHLNKAEAGHLAQSKTRSRKLFEVKTDEVKKIGEKVTIDILAEGEYVNVTAVSKGKGFQGTVKRHNFKTGPKTHGSNNYRQPGSIGSTFPQRVVKGRRMGGHMGAERVTTKNLEVYKLDKENHRIYLRGAVPGANLSGVLVWSNKPKAETPEVTDES